MGNQEEAGSPLPSSLWGHFCRTYWWRQKRKSAQVQGEGCELPLDGGGARCHEEKNLGSGRCFLLGPFGRVFSAAVCLFLFSAGLLWGPASSGRVPGAVTGAGSSLVGRRPAVLRPAPRPPDPPVSGAGCLEGRAGPLDALWGAPTESHVWTRQRPAPEGSEWRRHWAGRAQGEERDGDKWAPVCPPTSRLSILTECVKENQHLACREPWGILHGTSWPELGFAQMRQKDTQVRYQVMQVTG